MEASPEPEQRKSPCEHQEQQQPSSLHHSLLGPSLLKAGQEQVDQHKVGEIIYNASKGSKFFKHEEKRDEQLTKRIELILKRKTQLESLDLSSDLRRVDEQIAILEANRDLTQYIVHVDCDAFYASVEELDRPWLRKVPMAVGGGVLTTCNYKAREFGVRSGMAGYIAKKLCPQLVFLPLNFDKYTSKATEVRQVLVKYDERYESASIDEAYLNITKYVRDHEGMTPDQVVEQIRQEVFEASKVTISAGIAPNAKVAKIASNQNKPNGQFRIANERQAVMDFMSTLPVRKVNGVGRVFERELEAIGIKTCSDIYPSRGILAKLFGEKACAFLLNCYLGVGRTKIQPTEDHERKSVGSETTFRDISEHTQLLAKLRSTAIDLERDLKTTQFSGRTVNLKVKLHTYQVYSRQRALQRAIHTADDLYKYALPLLQGLEREFKPLRIRLMGLRMTQLVSMKKGERAKNFFGNIAEPLVSKKPLPTQQQPGAAAAADDDEEEWEVWPEEEFEQSQAAEKDEDDLLQHQLSQELLDEEEEGGGDEEKEDKHHDNNNAGPQPSIISGASEITTGSMSKSVSISIVRTMNTLQKAQAQAATTKQAEKWACPICARSLPADDALFNEHVDFCLSRDIIREAVQESSNPSPHGEGGGGSGAVVERKRGGDRDAAEESRAKRRAFFGK